MCRLVDLARVGRAAFPDAPGGARRGPSQNKGGVHSPPGFHELLRSPSSAESVVFPLHRRECWGHTEVEAARWRVSHPSAMSAGRGPHLGTGAVLADGMLVGEVTRVPTRQAFQDSDTAGARGQMTCFVPGLDDRSTAQGGGMLTPPPELA